MGYMIAQTMRTYGMGYQETMSMPMRAFWIISGFVDRVLADEGRLTLEISTAAQSSEAAESLFERLDKQAPNPVKYSGAALMMANSKRDERATEKLRQLAAMAG